MNLKVSLKAENGLFVFLKKKIKIKIKEKKGKEKKEIINFNTFIYLNF
jgi:hypothetical protein